MSMEAAQDSYDVIVIGAGLAGLTAGALLAQQGEKVLVVEKEAQPGGFIREFRYGPYCFNPAIHSIMGCNPSGPVGQGVIDGLLRQLDVRDQCQFVAVDPFFRAQFPDFVLDMPLGREPFLAAYQRHFPDEAAGFRDLADLCATIFEEFMRFPTAFRWQDWLLMPLRSPKMFRYANATLTDVLNKYLPNSRLQAVYGLLYPYLALPPSRVSFNLYAIMMAAYIEEGAYYCQGGFQNMAAALATGVSKHGGELLLQTPVRGIEAEQGRVTGVFLANGQAIAAPLVISNIDVSVMCQKMLPADQIPANYSRKLAKLEPSVSVRSLLLATDLDVHALNIPKVTLVSPWDLEEAFAAARRGEVKAVAIHVPTVLDATLSPPGEHLIIIQALVPSQAGRLSPAANARFAESLLDLAEQVLPGLRDHITFVAGNSEQGQETYPTVRLGPMYGWANSPQQVGPRRLALQTPIAGLYLTGHWTQPGSGVWTVVLSGINAARYALGSDKSAPMWPLDF